MLAQQIRVSEQRPRLHTHVINTITTKAESHQHHQMKELSQWVPNRNDSHNPEVKSTNAGRDALGIAKGSTNTRQCICEFDCFEKEP